MTRREQELDDRRAQAAALVTALNAVVKVMERLEPKSEKNEREKEGGVFNCHVEWRFINPTRI